MKPVALLAAEVAPRAKRSNYPEPFGARVAGRAKRQLGEAFGLANFGVNLTTLAPGMCAGFKAGNGNAHHLLNETSEDVVYLEVGDRTPGDSASYPDDDLMATFIEGAWRFTRKDGSSY